MKKRSHKLQFEKQTISRFSIKKIAGGIAAGSDFCTAGPKYSKDYGNACEYNSVNCGHTN